MPGTIVKTGIQQVHLDSPSEPDGKPVFVQAPFTDGLYMFVSARGDSLVSGQLTRGGGTKLMLEWTGEEGEAATKEVLATFHETVEMHDGHIDFDPDDWGFDDDWSVFVRVPATPSPVVNESTSGNCYVVPVGPGVNTIVPAYDAQGMPIGTHDVDLTTAVAVPYEDGGYWDYDPWEDEFTPAGPGADWMLFDFPMEDTYLVRNMMCSSRRGFWELDAYKVEPIYARWQFGLRCTRTTSGAGVIGGHYTCFREDAT